MSSLALATLTPLDVVRQVCPDASLSDAHYLLWNCTSFPFGPTMEKYRQDLLTLKLTSDGCAPPCDFCGSPGFDGGLTTICDRCYQAIGGER